MHICAKVYMHVYTYAHVVLMTLGAGEGDGTVNRKSMEAPPHTHTSKYHEVRGVDRSVPCPVSGLMRWERLLR